MRLLIEISYEKLLLPESTNAAAVLEVSSQVACSENLAWWIVNVQEAKIEQLRIELAYCSDGTLIMRDDVVKKEAKEDEP